MCSYLAFPSKQKYILDALASLKTMLDIQSVINSCFQDFKIKEY